MGAVEDAAPGPVVHGNAEKSSRALQPPEHGRRFRVRHSQLRVSRPRRVVSIAGEGSGRGEPHDVDLHQFVLAHEAPLQPPTVLGEGREDKLLVSPEGRDPVGGHARHEDVGHPGPAQRLSSRRRGPS